MSDDLRAAILAELRHVLMGRVAEEMADRITAIVDKRERRAAG